MVQLNILVLKNKNNIVAIRHVSIFKIGLYQKCFCSRGYTQNPAVAAYSAPQTPDFGERREGKEEKEGNSPYMSKKRVK